MSFAKMLNHVCTVYRSPETVDAFGDVGGAFVAQSPTERLALAPPKGGLQNFGAGEMPAGFLVGGMRANANVARRDILDVTSGPEAPSKWRVVAIAHPSGHHVELMLEPFTGNIA